MAAEKVTKAAPTAPNADKKRAIETAMAQIEKLYGKGSIMRCGDEQAANVEAISTGSLALDLALGIGGLPKGRIVEIYGPESSGKTTLALHVLAQAQKAGGEVAFIDAEHALDIGYARALGVNVEDMLVSQPDTAPARSTSSWWTPSPRSCRARRSRARWATALSASTPALCRRRCASSPARSTRPTASSSSSTSCARRSA